MSRRCPCHHRGHRRRCRMHCRRAWRACVLPCVASLLPWPRQSILEWMLEKGKGISKLSGAYHSRREVELTLRVIARFCFLLAALLFGLLCLFLEGQGWKVQLGKYADQGGTLGFGKERGSSDRILTSSMALAFFMRPSSRRRS